MASRNPSSNPSSLAWPCSTRARRSDNCFMSSRIRASNPSILASNASIFASRRDSNPSIFASRRDSNPSIFASRRDSDSLIFASRRDSSRAYVLPDVLPQAADAGHYQPGKGRAYRHDRNQDASQLDAHTSSLSDGPFSHGPQGKTTEKRPGSRGAPDRTRPNLPFSPSYCSDCLLYGQSIVRAVCDRPIRDRAVIDCTYNGSRSGSEASKSLNIEHVGAVYDCTNQVRAGHPNP